MLIIAHRGYSSRFRENSWAAWRGAANHGADLVETDIRFTGDGVCVCSHDPDLNRLAGRPVVVEEVHSRDLASILSKGAPAAPLFASALDAVPTEVGLLLDVKDERPASLARLSEIVKAAGARRIVLGLHAIDSIAAMHAYGHRDILGLLEDDVLEDDFLVAGGAIMRLWERNARQERIEALLERGLPVWITVGGRGTDRTTGDFDPDALRRFAAWGVSGVLVDDPVGARSALGEPA